MTDKPKRYSKYRLPDRVEKAPNGFTRLLIDMGRASVHVSLKERRENFKEIEHNTSFFELNERKIRCDQEMIPVLNWLNNLPNVKTHFSCQGNLSYQSPYVMFDSLDTEITQYILKVFEEFYMPIFEEQLNNHHKIETTIDFHTPEKYGSYDNSPPPRIRYVARWIDILALQDFNLFLNEHPIKRKLTTEEEIEIDNLVNEITEGNIFDGDY